MKTFKLFAMITAIALFTFSCKKDNEIIDTGSKISALVPKGTIVPIAERHITLTGLSEGAALKIEKGGRWWKIKDGAKVVAFNVVCSGQKVADEVTTADLDDDRFYISFSNNGDIMKSTTADGANAIKEGTWKWKNANKDAIEITSEDEDEPGETNVSVYYLTWLDNDNLVYVYVDGKFPSENCTGNINVYIQTEAVK